MRAKNLGAKSVSRVLFESSLTNTHRQTRDIPGGCCQLHQGHARTPKHGRANERVRRHCYPAQQSTAGMLSAACAAQLTAQELAGDVGTLANADGWRRDDVGHDCRADPAAEYDHDDGAALTMMLHYCDGDYLKIEGVYLWFLRLVMFFE